MTENDIADLFQKASVPAVQFVATQDGASRSKIGGLPDVPAHFPWPMWKGYPLAFVAQVDLRAITTEHSLSGLPRDGMLYFFYEQEQSTWGFDPQDRGSWRVMYVSGSVDLTPATRPPG